LPPETAKLMVQKLLNKDWKPEDIARELHLSVKEVNKMISALKKEQDE
jgi:biotin operon repressor